MLFMKQPKHKVFDYPPQYYRPEEDEELKDEERRRRKLGFRTSRARHKVKNKRQLYYIILFGIILYLYFMFSGNI